MPAAALAMLAPPQEAVPGAVRGQVMVVDDNADLREYMRRILGAAGHTVQVAADGQEALDMARTARAGPHRLGRDDAAPGRLRPGAGRARRRGAARDPVVLLSARAGRKRASAAWPPARMTT